MYTKEKMSHNISNQLHRRVHKIQSNECSEIKEALQSEPDIMSLYTIKDYISKGEFGYIFQGETKIGSLPIALKVEVVKSKSDPTVIAREFNCINEFTIYDHLPRGYDMFKGILYTKHPEYNVKCITMDLMGCDLKTWLSKQPSKISKETSDYLIHQLIETMAHFHSYSFVHQDIKLKNFCVALGDDASLFPLIKLIDFGEAQTIFDLQNGVRDPTNIIGTPLYSSLNSEEIKVQSYADDMESIGYIVWEMMEGSLPWQQFKLEDITERKELKRSCISSTKTPKPIRDYITACRNTPKWELPNYEQLLSFLVSNPKPIQMKNKLVQKKNELVTINIYQGCTPEFITNRKFQNSKLPLVIEANIIPGIDQPCVDMLQKHGVTQSKQLNHKFHALHRSETDICNWLSSMGLPQEKAAICAYALKKKFS